MKRSLRYCGAVTMSDLKIIVLVSLLTSWSMAFVPSSSMRDLLGLSKVLFALILATQC